MGTPGRKLGWMSDEEFFGIVNSHSNYSAAREITQKYGIPVSESAIRREKKRRGETKNIKSMPLEDVIQEVQSKGYMVTKVALKQDYRFDAGKLFKLKNLDVLKLGLVSDTQLCSRYQQLTHLTSFYKYCEQRGVDAVLHMGDISDGQHMYKGHEFELFLHGADAQSNYIIENYPSSKKFDTYFIGGNHDESFWKEGGHDICERISDNRKDMHYLGFHGAYLYLDMHEKIWMYMMHPDGGVPYARSYRPQKIIEQFSPQNKPHILFLGHLHVTDYLNSYRNVTSFMLPCFQSQTPYLKRKGLFPEIGGVIITINFDVSLPEGGFISVIHEWFSFYEPIEDDW